MTDTLPRATPADLEAVWQRLLALRWQSMDDAPRDGKRFLAHWNGGGIVPVRWCGWWDSGGFTQPTPTAWMPLPPVKD